MLLRVIVLFLFGWASAVAQMPVTSETSEIFTRVLAEGKGGARLECRVDPQKPDLDFAFRFEAGYKIQCPVRQFSGKQKQLYAFARVTPDQGTATVFGERFDIPAMPDDLKDRVQLQKIRSEFEFSGAFATGEGRYLVEVIVCDGDMHFATRKWRMTATRSRENQGVAISMPPGTVGPLLLHPYRQENVASPATPRITVLLDAAPINSHSQKLRAWDRALLLGSLSSVLRHLPSASVRLIAFNLDQQREVFRDENFSARGWFSLLRHLQDVELGTVSYSALQQKEGWSDLLLKLVNDEVQGEERSEAVIFLGPTIHLRDPIPAGRIPPRTKAKPHFFYIEYYPSWQQGSEFPDVLANVTREMDGCVLKIHTPGELADAIQRIQHSLVELPVEAAGRS